jgi:hypothetical protein
VLWISSSHSKWGHLKMIFSYWDIKVVKREPDQEHTSQHYIYVLIQGSAIGCLMSNPSCFYSLSHTCFDYKVVIISCKMQTYRTYKKDCWDFKHLQVRNENRHSDVCTCIVIPNSNSLTDTSCIHIQSVVNRQQHGQYSVYHTAERTDHVVHKIWIHYSSSVWI